MQPLRWEFNQISKPDDSITIFGANYHFFGTPYDGQPNYTPDSVDDDPPWRSFEKDILSVTNYFDLSSSGPITNRYEVMAYAAQARSTALGRTADVLGLSAPPLDLQTIWPSDSYPNHPFGAHFYHSAQFRGDYWQETNYWHTLLYSGISGFGINP